jgi:hypothetical protein
MTQAWRIAPHHQQRKVVFQGPFRSGQDRQSFGDEFRLGTPVKSGQLHRWVLEGPGAPLHQAIGEQQQRVPFQKGYPAFLEGMPSLQSQGWIMGP